MNQEPHSPEADNENQAKPLQNPMTRRQALGLGVIVAGGAGIVALVRHEAQNHYGVVSHIESLEHSKNEAVAGLGDLEALSGNRELFDGVMQFFDVSVEGAYSWQAAALEQSVKAELFSLNILDLSGLNLAKPGTEKQLVNKYFRALFSELLPRGITPDDAGTFVLAPEFVVGFGGEPSDYAGYLNMFLEEINQVAPSAQTSNMVDLNETKVLLAKLPEVKTDLLDNVGIQAFADGRGIAFDSGGKADISSYLTAKQVQKVVSALGNKPTWLNTGIIRKDAGLGVKYSLAQRMAIAEATADVVEELKNTGTNVSGVNLFAENKYNGRDASLNAERRDFSFHPGDEQILIIFSERLQALGVELSGYALPHDYLKKA